MKFYIMAVLVESTVCPSDTTIILMINALLGICYINYQELIPFDLPIL